MLLLDLTHTSHTRARTGIQRVARALHENLSDQAIPVTRDPFVGAWRPLERWELANLAVTKGGHKRKAHWPVWARWRGRYRRLVGATSAHAIRGEYDGFIAPELFSPQVARDLPNLFLHIRGPRIALFHDAIPLRFPELTPGRTVARFPVYLRELLVFDGIAAISEDSRDSLVEYWKWLGVTNPPPVQALPLGVQPIATAAAPAPSIGDRRVVLSVGTIEGRKNHLALLDACEHLWTRGLKFELRIIGHANEETGAPALARIRDLQKVGRALTYEGPATDEQITAAYAQSAFTVYPSLVEGFGLPVIESLARGKPCVCSGRGATGEIAREGGCVGLDSVDAASLASAIAELLNSPERLADLAAVAQQRRFRTWAEYARELTTWMQSLARR